MAIQKVGVIGSGLMGSGIAEIAAKSGFEVTVVEVDQETLDRGRGRIEKSMARAVDKGKLSESDRNDAMDRLSFTTSLEDPAVAREGAGRGRAVAPPPRESGSAEPSSLRRPLCTRSFSTRRAMAAVRRATSASVGGGSGQKRGDS